MFIFVSSYRSAFTFRSKSPFFLSQYRPLDLVLCVLSSCGIFFWISFYISIRRTNIVLWISYMFSVLRSASQLFYSASPSGCLVLFLLHSKGPVPLAAPGGDSLRKLLVTIMFYLISIHFLHFSTSRSGWKTACKNCCNFLFKFLIY